MPSKNSKRDMTRLIKVLQRNRALKKAAHKSYARPASAVAATPVADNNTEAAPTAEGNQE